MATLEGVLAVMKGNFFDPAKHQATVIPDQPGNYLFCLRVNSQLPSLPAIEIPQLTRFEGYQVIYTGISKKSLHGRDYKKHFAGNNAGRSTLRKSLGVLFGYKQIPRDKDPATGKTKFNDEDEAKLSLWMKTNLVMFYYPNLEPAELEGQLIQFLNPPLNLQSNYQSVNSIFRRQLSALRGSGKEED